MMLLECEVIYLAAPPPNISHFLSQPVSLFCRGCLAAKTIFTSICPTFNAKIGKFYSHLKVWTVCMVPHVK